MKDTVTSIVIMGTVYTIEKHKISEDKVLKENDFQGYCSEDAKLIVVADYDEKEYYPYLTKKEKAASYKETLRHEIVHAFLNESGLSSSSLRYNGAWAENEEMVDWIAIQSPKIFKVFEELDIL